MRPGSGCGYREACCHGMSASPFTVAVTVKEKDVVRGYIKWRGKRGRSWWSERACWYPSFQFFLQCVHLVPVLE